MPATTMEPLSPSHPPSLPPQARFRRPHGPSPAQRGGSQAGAVGGRRIRFTLPLLAVLATTGAGGCSPYPDDGEFLAGVVYSANFMASVRTIDRLSAVGRGVGAAPLAPYTVVATTRGSETTRAVSSSSAASAPFWTDGGKRQPLARSSAQTVYVFDSACSAPPNYQYDERLDLIRQDRQYPLFSDLPEVLSTNNGKGGRTGAYSAVVEVVHLRGSGSLPCQSIKRLETAQSRIGKDLTEVRREYRLFQAIDPMIASVPLPVQLGFYNQLVVPYIDMGPVPLEPDGNAFRTMPLYRVTDSKGAASTVVMGQSDEAGPAYSPICRDYTLQLAAGATAPLDAADPALRTATKTDNLASCLVCRTVDAEGTIDCPFANSQAGQP